MRLWLKAFLGVLAVVLGASTLWLWAATLTGPPGRNVVFTETDTVDTPRLKQNGQPVAVGPNLSVKVATTANITLSGTPQTIDSIAVATNDSVMVKNQAAGATNGVYVVAAGAWTRRFDADESTELSTNAVFYVEQGATQSGSLCRLTTLGAITLGTTSLTFGCVGAGGGVSTLDQAFDNGNVIDSAVTGTREFRIGTAASYLSLSDDATFGPTIGATSAGSSDDIILDVQTGKNLITRLAGTTVKTLTSPGGVSTLTGAGKLRKTIYLPADAFYMQGCTLTTNAAIVSGGLVEPFMSCAANDTHGFHRALIMPKSWDGGAFQVTMDVVNVMATPANNYRVDFSAACLMNAAAYATTISITGERPVNVDFDAGQSCGASPCAQNQLVSVVNTGAPDIVPNGTCTTGTSRLLRLQGQVNAAGTTVTSPATNVKVVGIAVEYLVSSESD